MINSQALHSAPSAKELEYLDGWRRALADLDNYRKRIAAGQEHEKERIKREVVAQFLPLADNFQALVRHVPASGSYHEWVEGVLHIARQLEQLIESLGIETINPKGMPFDPMVHEAVAGVQPDGQQRGVITEVTQLGYRIGDTVIRPARVKVAS